MRYRDWWPECARRCDTMAIKPERVPEFQRMANYAIANKAIYEQAEAATASHFPWFAVAAMHKRESDAQDAHGNPLFTSYLGNGQPLWISTTIEPLRRGPFITKEEALGNPQKCIAAFVAGCVDALHLDKVDQVVPPWPLEKLLFNEQILNGTGYEPKPSPYLWGGTTIQVIGKYIRDHVYDGTVWDTQLGVAGMFWMIAHLDTTVRFTRET